MRREKPFVVGVTGTIGSGKSTVGRILERHGVPVIDSDQVVHQLFADNDELKKAVARRFGDRVMVKDSDTGSETINRTALGEIVFADRGCRKDLESIVHPLTVSRIAALVADLSGHDLVAVLVPLLFEARLEGHYDEIWTVFTSEEKLKARLADRDNLTGEDIEVRLLAQLPQSEKMARASHTIDNSMSLSDTEEQVVKLLERLRGDLR